MEFRTVRASLMMIGALAAAMVAQIRARRSDLRNSGIDLRLVLGGREAWGHSNRGEIWKPLEPARVVRAIRGGRKVRGEVIEGERERERCKVHRSELLLLDIYIILIIGWIEWLLWLLNGGDFPFLAKWEFTASTHGEQSGTTSGKETSHSFVIAGWVLISILFLNLTY